ncbi:hypothetical protein [Paraburkholderia atlantica]|uniref:hypothetical protein n=1 Tax=Paraburkholderia atlantica TaxID=2654982 RepID=UPI0016128D2F|nr:hypothetical protein [Paraburkholderia atlantica]MBB5509555.1 hypothetical protein [Paraburkholderia atlantica]
MTLPASFPLSMSQVATELGLSLPLSMNHAWVLALAQKGGLPMSFSDLLGKTGRFDGSVTTGAISHARSIDWTNGSAPFFGTSLQEVVWNSSSSVSLFVWGATVWTGNILVKNNTTGVSAVLAPISGQWNNSSCDANNIIRIGATDNYTILPSS